MSKLKDELIEAFARMNYAFHGEQVLRDSQETEYQFIKSGEIIKVITPSSTYGHGDKPRIVP